MIMNDSKIVKWKENSRLSKPAMSKIATDSLKISHITVFTIHFMSLNHTLNPFSIISYNYILGIPMAILDIYTNILLQRITQTKFRCVSVSKKLDSV